MMLRVISILREEWDIWKYLRGMRGCTKRGSVESEKREVLRSKGGGGRSPRREQRPLVAPGWACRKRHLRPMINKSDKVLRFKAVKL
jgi:hypothetical protein